MENFDQNLSTQKSDFKNLCKFISPRLRDGLAKKNSQQPSNKVKEEATVKRDDPIRPDDEDDEMKKALAASLESLKQEEKHRKHVNIK